jgi:hypothetical protein
VTLAGKVTDEEIVDLYRRAWVVASASIAEGWGMTLTEAAACGTPAVARRIAGHLDAVYQANAGDSWSPPFFFDEMWRADFIRSGQPIDRMLTHDTPIPMGWVALMHVVTAPFQYQPVTFRVISAVWFLAGVAVLTVLFVRILQRRPRGAERFRLRERPWPAPIVAAPLGVALAMYVPLVTVYTQWFNNYTFEIFYIALLLLAAEELDRSPRAAFPAFCLLVALAPFMVLGGLLAVPGLVLCAFWWALRSDAAERPSRIIVLAFSCVGAAVTGVVAWSKVYKPVSAKPSISSYWIEYGSSLGGTEGVGDLLHKTYTQLIAGLIGDRLYFADGWVRWTAYAVLAMSMVVGLITIGRRWGWLLVTVVLAWVLSIVGSALIHWPMTVERVNLCWQIVVFAIAGVGLARSVLWCAGRHTWVGLPVVGLVFVALWFKPYPVGIDTFDRNLTNDLQPVAGSPAQHNLVFEYNQLTQFYADNELINTKHGDKTFDLRWEGETGASPEPFLQPLDPLVRDAKLASGDMVWCVIPGEIGDETPFACQFTDPSGLELVTNAKGRDATVVGYRVR